jgi:hypothetical protein
MAMIFIAVLDVVVHFVGFLLAKWKGWLLILILENIISFHKLGLVDLLDPSFIKIVNSHLSDERIGDNFAVILLILRL